MMGLDNWMHWLAWFTKCFVFLIASVVLMTIFLKVITLLKHKEMFFFFTVKQYLCLNNNVLC